MADRRRRAQHRDRAKRAGKASERQRPPAAPEELQLAEGNPRWLRRLVFVVASVYLLGLLLDGAAPRANQRLLPPTALFFVQATCLFPHAATMAIDYRLEGWDCGARTFRELDPAPYFPIRSRDKESRFQRLGHFHRRNRPVLEALERYVLAQENARSADTRWGGVRLSSVRIPLPDPGQPVPRWAPPSLADHPRDLIKAWFYTPVSRRERHCEGDQP